MTKIRLNPAAVEPRSTQSSFSTQLPPGSLSVSVAPAVILFICNALGTKKPLGAYSLGIRREHHTPVHSVQRHLFKITHDFLPYRSSATSSVIIFSEYVSIFSLILRNSSAAPFSRCQLFRSYFRPFTPQILHQLHS